MKNAPACLTAFTLLVLSGCSTAPEQTRTYTTASVPQPATTDAVVGLEEGDADAYPMLKHKSPGMYQLNKRY